MYGRFFLRRKTKGWGGNCVSTETLKVRTDLQDMVRGLEGIYTVTGSNLQGKIVSRNFAVKPQWLEQRHEMPGRFILVIEEEVSSGDTHSPVYILHKWLKKDIGRISFVKGKIGETQYAMLSFLQKNLEELSPSTLQEFSDVDQVDPDDVDPVALPVHGVDISSMKRVDAEHQLGEEL
jgi:hypothetical protein